MSTSSTTAMMFYAVLITCCRAFLSWVMHMPVFDTTEKKWQHIKRHIIFSLKHGNNNLSLCKIDLALKHNYFLNSLKFSFSGLNKSMLWFCRNKGCACVQTSLHVDSGQIIYHFLVSTVQQASLHHAIFLLFPPFQWGDQSDYIVSEYIVCINCTKTMHKL